MVVSQFENSIRLTLLRDPLGFPYTLEGNVGGCQWTSITQLIPSIRAFRPFLHAKDFELSLRFYEAIGFSAYRLGDTLVELSLGAHAFLLRVTT